MADIFGYKRNQKPRGVFSSENSTLNFGSVSAKSGGYLVQNWNVNYTQQLQEVFEIGSDEIYWVKGRPVGQGQLTRLIGDQEADTGGGQNAFFPKKAFDICDGGELIVLRAKGGACKQGVNGAAPVNSKGVAISMDGCVITSVGFSMQVADVRLVENFAWRFGFMEVKSA
jgi:hypothetical protein